MTSGNASEEPICITNDEALERLTSIADAVLMHDRDVVARYDDSVVRVRTGGREPSVMRRARSFAPTPLELANEVPPILGTGSLLTAPSASRMGSGRSCPSTSATSTPKRRWTLIAPRSIDSGPWSASSPGWWRTTCIPTS